VDEYRVSIPLETRGCQGILYWKVWK